MEEIVSFFNVNETSGKHWEVIIHYI